MRDSVTLFVFRSFPQLLIQDSFPFTPSKRVGVFERHLFDGLVPAGTGEYCCYCRCTLCCFRVQVAREAACSMRRHVRYITRASGARPNVQHATCNVKRVTCVRIVLPRLEQRAESWKRNGIMRVAWRCRVPTVGAA
jgi:hypothetical protein